MALFELEPGDEEFLDECPVCCKGYMVPTYGHWYQCSERGEAKTTESFSKPSRWESSGEDVHCK